MGSARWRTRRIAGQQEARSICIIVRASQANRYIPIWTRGSGVAGRSLIRPSCWVDQDVLGETPGSIVCCPATMWSLKVFGRREAKGRVGSAGEGRSSSGRAMLYARRNWLSRSGRSFGVARDSREFQRNAIKIKQTRDAPAKHRLCKTSMVASGK